MEIRFYRKEDRRPGQDRDDNRDPISGARGAHPVGTGVGAVAGGAATGAAVGSVAGPVGTAAGVVGGAVVGGLVGKGVAEAANPTSGSGNWEQYIGHHVIDRDEEMIGKLSALWTDESGNPAFLGVRTGWLMGKTHVFPAEAAELDARRERIRLPFSVQAVKEAPTFDPDCELSDVDEERIRQYFSRFGYKQGREGGEASSTRGQCATGQSEKASVKLSEEQVKVGKREVVAGGVRLRKIVRTETVNQPVQLRREDIVVERVPGSETSGRAQHEFEEREIYVPLRREEAVIQKEAHVREEVRVRKDAKTDTRTVSEQVRKEDVEIQREGEARAAGRSGGK